MIHGTGGFWMIRGELKGWDNWIVLHVTAPHILGLKRVGQCEWNMGKQVDKNE